MISKEDIKNSFYTVFEGPFCDALYEALTEVLPSDDYIDYMHMLAFKSKLLAGLATFCETFADNLYGHLLSIEFEGTMALIITVGSPTTQTANPVTVKTVQTTMGVSAVPNQISLYQKTAD